MSEHDDVMIEITDNSCCYLLQDYVDDIRAKYTRDWSSKDLFKQQMGVALYFIDKLALRAGHEKDDDEADTVGCCTLKV